MMRLRLLWLYLLCLCMQGCFFHPQGQMQLAPPLQRMYIQSPDPYGQLTRSLIQNLTMSHVTLTASPTLATTVLAILQDTHSQTLLSVSGTQQTRQYNLMVTIQFELTTHDGKTILPPQTLSDSRTITIQSNQVLGSSNEANIYLQQMRRSLASAILNRIASQEVSDLCARTFTKPPIKHSRHPGAKHP